MIHKRIINLNSLDNNKKEKIYNSALLKSYYFHIDEIKEGSFSRTEVDASFEEILKLALLNKNTYWTIIYRDLSFIKGEINYWEFGLKVEGIFVWIKLNEFSANELIKRFKLLVNE